MERRPYVPPILSHSATPEYRENWERTFGKAPSAEDVATFERSVEHAKPKHPVTEAQDNFAAGMDAMKCAERGCKRMSLDDGGMCARHKLEAEWNTGQFKLAAIFPEHQGEFVVKTKPPSQQVDLVADPALGMLTARAQRKYESEADSSRADLSVLCRCGHPRAVHEDVRYGSSSVNLDGCFDCGCVGFRERDLPPCPYPKPKNSRPAKRRRAKPKC